MKLCCGWRCACSVASPATADESARAVVQPFPLADEFIDFEVRIRTLRSDLESERVQTFVQQANSLCFRFFATTTIPTPQFATRL